MYATSEITCFNKNYQIYKTTSQFDPNNPQEIDNKKGLNGITYLCNYVLRVYVCKLS